MNRLPLLLCITLLSPLALADSVVVGTGSAASCSTAAYNTAMQILTDGPQARGGTLTFSCGPQPHSIAMDRDWALTDGVLIDGAGRVTLDAQNLHRFYQTFLLFEGQTSVTLKDITLIRGFANTDFGGAIYQHSGTSLTLDGVTIADSRATTSGGAIASETQTTLTIIDSQFLNNRAGFGGALAIRAATQISGSKFAGNRAEAGNAEGGAIQSYEQSLTTTNSIFEENISARDGGAIYKRDATLTLEDVSLLRNNAPTNGAGVYAHASTSVIGDRIKVIGNIGHGVHVEGGLTLRRASFLENRNNAIGKSSLDIKSGPAALLVEKSVFANNDNGITIERDAEATGIAGTLRLDNVTLHNNRFSSIGLLDFAGGVTLLIDQSSIVEPGCIPVAAFRGQVTYTSSIIFGGGISNCTNYGNPPLQFASGGNNLLGPGCPLGGGDSAVQALADLQLSDLAEQGGAVATLLPASTSPAIDRRNCVNVDARDLPRPIDGDQSGSSLCDIGAAERQLSETGSMLLSDSFE